MCWNPQRLPRQELNLLNLLLWSSEFILLALGLTTVKSHQGFWFFGHCELSKSLESKGEEEKVELPSLGDVDSFGSVSLQSRGNMCKASGSELQKSVASCQVSFSHSPHLHFWRFALQGFGYNWALKILYIRGCGNFYHGTRVDQLSQPPLSF